MIALVLGRMLPFALLVAAALAAVRTVAPGKFAHRLHTASRGWPWLGGLLLALFAGGLLCSLALPVAMDMVEVTVAELAALVLRGEPLYTTLDAAHRYSLLYGPLCALPFALGLRVLGSSMAALKAVLAATDAAALLLLFVAFRRSLSRAGAVAAVGGVAAALMMRNLSAFQVRGDALLLFAVALALVAAGTRRAPWAGLWFACAVAVAVDVKFTAAFYLLVPAWLLWQRHGGRVLVSAAAGAAVLASVPFALPQVSWQHYLLWLQEAAHHPLSTRLLLANAVAVVLFLLPVLMLWLAVYGSGQAALQRFATNRWVLLTLLAISLLGSMVTGAKVGAGRSHLNGSVLVLAQLAVLLWARLPAERRLRPALQVALALYAPCLVVPAVLQARELVAIGPQRRAEALQILRELDGIAAAHPGPVEMGYDAAHDEGEPLDPLTLYRTRFVLRGGPVTVDGAALFDMQLSGLAMPQATVDAMRRCEVRTWVLPASAEPPFTTRNGYADDAPGRLPDPMLFSSAFRAAFHAAYRRTATTPHFEVWTCTEPGSPGSPG